jgi:hypothetical protein
MKKKEGIGRGGGGVVLVGVGMCRRCRCCGLLVGLGRWNAAVVLTLKSEITHKTKPVRTLWFGNGIIDTWSFMDYR